MSLAKTKFYAIHVVVAVIALACILMNGPMRGGLPIDNTITERTLFIASNRALWSLSWLTWMFSAIGLFIFSAILADELHKNILRTVGIALVGMGIGPDLIAEVIYAFIIPEVIARNLDQQFIEFLEVTAMHLTGFLGNGLYNIGGLLLTLLAIKQGVIRSWVAAWGILAWILGLMLSVSVALGTLKAAEFFTASSMVLSTLWMLVFAHKVVKP